MDSHRAQASTELFVLVAFFLVFLIPIVFLMMNLSGEKANEASLAQAQQLGRRMTDLADQVYIQGGAAQKVEALFFPANIINLNVGGDAPDKHEIVITVSTYNGETDLVFMTTAPLSTTTDWTGQPDLYLGAGMKKVRVYNEPADNSVAIDYEP
ncbi:MAG: hypothetical protein Q7T16_02740 [Candidatus Burarchaeum sp.]|nr:hypothetical protein [Candidatus Burarchaeum sp.]MDO8339551.1 hypothetical protein [Candidatus Burarchaeum sp.]